jgi:signal transduction histidine kinase
MSLRAKLTLASVLLATLIVAAVSLVDLSSLVQSQFQSTLERAELVKDVATEALKDTLNRPGGPSMQEGLHDPVLLQRLNKLLGQSKTLSEIALVAPLPSNTVLVSTVIDHVGQPTPDVADFQEFVDKANMWDKARLLANKEPVYFKLGADLGSGEVVYFRLRLIVNPWLLRNDLWPSIKENLNIALFSIGGAVLLTFLFSAVAFRTLGRIGRMLDLVARGEFEPDTPAPAAKQATDELSVMASKVSLLGQRLRGAQFEVHDLRGNIDRLLQELEDAVFIFNRELRLVFASGSVERFLGHSRSDLPGRLIQDIFPPATTLGLLVAQAAETNRPLRNRRVPMGDAGTERIGPAVVLLSVDLLESLPDGPGSGTGLLVRLRDPEAQRKIGRELQTADRLAAISQVSSGVAHEVKNPLNAILLHVEVAKAKLKKGDTDVGQQMEIVSSEILRLDRVVRTFLDFTRPVELKLANVPLQDLVREMVDLARPQAAAAGIRVHSQPEVENVEVRIDRDLFKQAMLNVVVNAMQAMPGGGDLTFEASAGEDTAEIRISDTGSGIPPELRDKIFRLYFSTKKEGSGIGLAMTFRIVQLHDGTIGFDSEPGKGTTFLIRLPIAV